MDTTHTALDEVWKADGGGGARGSYPQARMAHLFDVIGAAICRYCCYHSTNCHMRAPGIHYHRRHCYLLIV